MCKFTAVLRAVTAVALTLATAASAADYATATEPLRPKTAYSAHRDQLFRAIVISVGLARDAHRSRQRHRRSVRGWPKLSS